MSCTEAGAAVGRRRTVGPALGPLRTAARSKVRKAGVRVRLRPSPTPTPTQTRTRTRRWAAPRAIQVGYAVFTTSSFRRHCRHTDLKFNKVFSFNSKYSICYHLLTKNRRHRTAGVVDEAEAARAPARPTLKEWAKSKQGQKIDRTIADPDALERLFQGLWWWLFVVGGAE